MDTLRLVMSEMDVLRQCAVDKTPPPPSFSTAVSAQLNDAYDLVVRSEHAPDDSHVRSVAACVVCEIVAARPASSPAPSIAAILRITAVVTKYNLVHLAELPAVLPTPASLSTDGLQDGDIGLVLATLAAIAKTAAAAPATTTNASSSSRAPRKTINIVQRLRELGLENLPELLLPSQDLVRAIQLKREDGCKLPLQLDPKGKILFPPNAAHSVSFVPSSLDLNEQVVDAAGLAYTVEGVREAKQALLLQTSAKLKNEVLPPLLHSLVRARHAIALIVCEAVAPRDYLRLLLLVTSIMPIVATHAMLQNRGTRAWVSTTYESWIFQRVHESSAETTVSDALSLLQKLDVDKIRHLDLSGSGIVESSAGEEYSGGGYTGGGNTGGGNTGGGNTGGGNTGSGNTGSGNTGSGNTGGGNSGGGRSGRARRTRPAPSYSPYEPPLQHPAPYAPPAFEVIRPSDAKGRKGSKGDKGDKGTPKTQGRHAKGKGKRQE